MNATKTKNACQAYKKVPGVPCALGGKKYRGRSERGDDECGGGWAGAGARGWLHGQPAMRYAVPNSLLSCGADAGAITGYASSLPAMSVSPRFAAD